MFSRINTQATLSVEIIAFYYFVKCCKQFAKRTKTEGICVVLDPCFLLSVLISKIIQRVSIKSDFQPSAEA